MDDNEEQKLRDDVRCEAAVQTLKDILMRADEMSEGTYTFYDLLGYLFEDLIRDGSCPACIQEVFTAVVNDLGVDVTNHHAEDHSVFH